MMWWTLAACVGTPVDADSDVLRTDTDLVGEMQTITLTTRDHVELVADRYPGTGEGVVVLFHMTPTGGATRQDWPDSFLSSLHGKGWTVLNVDRRGAGDSGGVAEDAFMGPKGKYDVEAAVHAVASSGPVFLIGASNGTTSILDYAVWAGGEGLPQPAGLAFMTGGTYTENQNHVSAVAQIPAIFTFSTAERAWSVSQQSATANRWEFAEYPNGAHGTRMFAAEPGIAADLVSFIDTVL